MGVGHRALVRAGHGRYHSGMDALTFLKERVPLFVGVSDENLSVLVSAAVLNSYGAGQTVLFKGATVDGLHVVATGRVSVHAKLAGKGLSRVAELGSGEIFGETSIVEMGTAGAAVKASEDNTLILMIPQDAFRHVLQQDEAFAVRVNTLICARKAALVPAAA